MWREHHVVGLRHQISDRSPGGGAGRSVRRKQVTNPVGIAEAAAFHDARESEDAMQMTLAAIGMAFATAVHAHEAPSGFTYVPFCCNGDGDSGDCRRFRPTPFAPVRKDMK